jgi:hypothetical protein
VRAVLLLWLLCPHSPPLAERLVQQTEGVECDPGPDRNSAPTHCPANQQHPTDSASTQKDEEMTPEEMTARLTGVLAAIAVFQLIMIGIQIWVSVQQLRAYVFAGKATMHTPFAERGGWVEVHIANRGQTPAYDCLVGRDYVFVDSAVDDPPLIDDSLLAPFGSLGPKGEVTTRLTLLPIGPAEMATLIAGTRYLYVFGEVRYRDAFRRNRFSRFCFAFGGHYGTNEGDGPLAIARKGNKAD